MCYFSLHNHKKALLLSSNTALSILRTELWFQVCHSLTVTVGKSLAILGLISSL